MGNPISGDLKEYTDNFLQDIAQMLGVIDYTDIMYATKRLTKDELVYLDKIAEEVYDEENSDEVGEKYFSFDTDYFILGIKDDKLNNILQKLHSELSSPKG